MSPRLLSWLWVGCIASLPGCGSTPASPSPVPPLSDSPAPETLQRAEPTCSSIAPHWATLFSEATEEQLAHVDDADREDLRDHFIGGIDAAQFIAWCEQWPFDPAMLDCVQMASSAVDLDQCEMKFQLRRQKAGRPLPGFLAGEESCTRLPECEQACSGGSRRACLRLPLSPVARDRQDAPRAFREVRALCSAGRAGSCAYLGYVAWQQAKQLPSGSSQSRRLLGLAAAHHARACHLGHGQSCYDLGLFHVYDREEGRDDQRAIELWRRGCAFDHALSCATAGMRHLEGWGVVYDRAEGIRLLLQGCDLGDRSGCNNGGNAVEKDGDKDRARALFVRGCELGEVLACQSARRLGASVNPPDADRIIADLHDGCTRGSAVSCGDLATHYEQGRLVAKDLVKANDYLKLACDQGNPGSCEGLGNNYLGGVGVIKDAGRAAALYERACAWNLASACTARADMLRHGWEVAKDPVAAAPFYDRACKAGWPRACGQLGIMYIMGEGVAADRERGVTMATASCQQRDAWTCQGLAIVIYHGQGGVPVDRERAVELFEVACELGEADSCLYAARVLAKELPGAERRQQRILDMANKLCSLGRKKFCPRRKAQPGK